MDTISGITEHKASDSPEPLGSFYGKISFTIILYYQTKPFL